MIRPQERVNFLTHLAGAVFMPFGMIYILFFAWPNPMLVLVTIVYGLSATLLFTASSTYHALKKEENSNTFLRKLDHISIFFMIAGTYTPMCVIALPQNWMILILSVQWGLVLTGTLAKLFWMKSPRWMTAAVYIAMGWVAVFAFKFLYDNLPTIAFAQMVAGGVVYSIGGVIYAIKRPNPIPGRFGFHEIFHIFILMGALLHYWMVLNAVQGYPG